MSRKRDRENDSEPSPVEKKSLVEEPLIDIHLEPRDSVDVVLRAGTTRFHTHSQILKQNSAYFRDLKMSSGETHALESAMKPTQENWHLFLRLLYKEIHVVPEDMAIMMCKLAQKFAVPHIWDLIKPTEDNIVELYVLADKKKKRAQLDAWRIMMLDACSSTISEKDISSRSKLLKQWHSLSRNTTFNLFTIVAPNAFLPITGLMYDRPGNVVRFRETRAMVLDAQVQKKPGKGRAASVVTLYKLITTDGDIHNGVRLHEIHPID